MDETVEMGKYGPIKPRTPAYGWTIMARVKPGHAKLIRKAATEVTAIENLSEVLKPLALHYLRWVLFDDDTRFLYAAIFDTDFDKYLEDAIKIFGELRRETFFVHLEGWPEDWRTNVSAAAKWVRQHHVDSFLEFSDYPNVTAKEVNKALKVKGALSEMLDQMQ